MARLRSTALCAFSSVFVAMALASYSMHDPSYHLQTFSLSPKSPIHNRGGLIGAQIADSLYTFFGMSSWVVPFLLAHQAWKLRADGWRSSILCGWGLVALSSAIFLEIFISDWPGLPGTAGGRLGAYLAYVGPWLIGGYGLLLVAFLSFYTGLTSLLRISFWQVLGFIFTPFAALGKIFWRPWWPKVTPKAAEKPKPLKELIPITEHRKQHVDHSLFIEQGQHLMAKLREFGLNAQVKGIAPGPVIVRFELQLAPGERSNKVVSLAKELARALKIAHIHVVENIPGKSTIGLDVPQVKRQVIELLPLLGDINEQKLPIVIGVESQGQPLILDLAKLPHLLVAGATGSGKSVGINAMLLSLLSHCQPSDLRLLLIDPKILEFSGYSDLPHLAAPVLTEAMQAIAALRWCVRLMDERYHTLAQNHVRHISDYHALRKKKSLPPMPYLVIVIDELADLMLMSKKLVEEPIARLAQKARACGIHLILATQRPSVDVITGLIKANIPARLAYAVSSKIDSRTIIDQQGAEDLLGMGDGFLSLPSASGLLRIHGAYMSDEDIEKLLTPLRAMKSPGYLFDLSDLADEEFLQEGN